MARTGCRDGVTFHLSWLLVASDAGSLRNPRRTRLERPETIVENRVVLSGVMHRVREVATRIVGWIADVVQVGTRPAPVVVGLLRDVTRSRGELVAEKLK